jgi:hypothetical protein
MRNGSAFSFDPCRYEGCDNFLIAEESQDSGECAQCREQRAIDMAYWKRSYDAASPAERRAVLTTVSR